MMESSAVETANLIENLCVGALSEEHKTELEKQLNDLCLNIRRYYVEKDDLDTSSKILLKRPSFFEELLLEDHNEISPLIERAYKISSILKGIEPKNENYFRVKKAQLDKEKRSAAIDILEIGNLIEAPKKLRGAKKGFTKSEEIELKRSLERAIKLAAEERKLREKYQKSRTFKPSRLRYDLGLLGKVGSIVSVAAEVALFAFLFGKECLSLYSTEKKIVQTEKTCQEIIKLGQIKNLFKGIEGKTFVVGESEELKPGTYNLLSFVKYDKNDRIRRYLEETEIEIDQIEPFSYPFTECKVGDEFGVYRKKIGGDPWHTGVDFNSNKDWNIKSCIDMKVTQTSYENKGGFFVKGKIGQLRANNTNDSRKNLEVILLNGQKFRIKVDSLKCCVKQGTYNKFSTKPIEYFDGKDLYIVYCHCKKNSIKVKIGENVKRGQVIAVKGKSGRAYSEHLHLELRTGGEPFTRIDIMPFFENEAIGNIDELYAITDSASNVLSYGINF